MTKIYVVQRHENVVEHSGSHVETEAVASALTRAEAESWVRAHDENGGKELYGNDTWVMYTVKEVEMV